MRHRRGFTLVEIMIVATIIGLLAALALPVFNNIRRTAQNSATASDLRVFSEAIQTYVLEMGSYPVEQGPGVLPPEMVDRIPAAKWNAVPPIGGQYDWDYQTGGHIASIAISAPIADMSQLQLLDKRVDDGDLSTGRIQYTSGSLRLIVE